MAENTPEAAVAPEAKTEAPDINTNTEPQAPEQKPEAPDMHGFTSDQLADMKKFFDANGGYEKLKSKLSNPEPRPETPAQTQPEAPQAPQTPEQPQAPTSPQTPPADAVTNDMIMTQYYFESLSRQEKYAPIAKEIADGSLLKEMASLGIDIHNPDGSFNDGKINAYLSLKAQTVPAKQTSAEPDASAAPTVDYVDVGDKITSMEQARAIMRQPGHPKMNDAYEYLRGELNPKKDSGQNIKPAV